MAKLLLVEDDEELLDILMTSLEAELHSVDTATDGEEAWEKLRFYKYDVIIMDWELPKLTGVEVMRQFRYSGGVTPILMLTGRKSIQDKEVGLDTGCDDYLTKPFDPRELTARIRALLRRPTTFAGTQLMAADIVLSLDTHRVTKGGNELQLSPMEYKLLEFLIRHKDQPFSPEALLDRVWNSSSDASIDTVRTLVKTLRKKIGDENGKSILQTIHGIGYKISG